MDIKIGMKQRLRLMWDQTRPEWHLDRSEYFCLVAESETPHAITSPLELVDGYGNKLCL